MSQDPEVRDFNPAVDRIWLVDKTLSVALYVTAADKAEAEEVADAHWRDELDSAADDYVDVTRVEGPIRSLEGTSLPWGRTYFRGQQLTVNQLAELIANPPPGPPSLTYDTQTILMPFADSPPPLRPEAE